MQQAERQQPVDNKRAALWLLASAVMFTGMSVLVKLLGSSLHPFQISFFRGVVSMLVIVPFLLRSGVLEGIKTKVPVLQFSRGVVGSVAMFLGFYAIVHLPLADAQAISFSRNLFIVPLAAIVLGELIGLRRAVAAGVGFIGVIIMLRPGTDMMGSGPALAALGHALLVALATVLVNIASRYDKPVTLIFYTNVVTIVLISIPAYFVWVGPDASQLWMLLAMGVFGVSAHHCFIRAYALGEASAIAPVDYSRLVMAAVVGVLLFQNVPDGYTILGAAIIVGASFYIIRREAQLARDTSQDPSQNPSQDPSQNPSQNLSQNSSQSGPVS
jgi:drug/metabolite transporter (DMT)-like permease